MSLPRIGDTKNIKKQHAHPNSWKELRFSSVLTLQIIDEKLLCNPKDTKETSDAYILTNDTEK